MTPERPYQLLYFILSIVSVIIIFYITLFFYV